MKLAILTDLHGNGINHFGFTLEDIKKCDLVISLGDNEESDLEIFKDLDIPKIGIHGNHDTVKDLKDTWLPKYGFENLHLKTKEINGIKFGGFDGNMGYVFAESMPNINNERMDLFRKDLDSILSKLNGVNILISHFPPYLIHDDINNTSHRGLKSLYELIRTNNDISYHFHGHMHREKKTEVFGTSLVGGYGVKIFEIGNTKIS